MVTVQELSRTDARRVAVRAQLLTKERPTDLLASRPFRPGARDWTATDAPSDIHDIVVQVASRVYLSPANPNVRN